MSGPRNRKSARTDRVNKLLAALDLVSFAQLKNGNAYETHVRVFDGKIFATNGKITISAPIEYDFEANPNTEEFIKALKRTGDNTALTIVNKHRIHLQSGKFSCYVQCIDDNYIPIQIPDPPVAHIHSGLLEAMVVCLAAIDEKADNPIFRGVWMDGYSVAASDRFSIFQVWHGIHLPNGLIIPGDAIKALIEKAKDETSLVKLGFTYNRSITFYFEDGTYVKSSLLEGKYPDYSKVLDQKSNQNSIPPDFFDGVRSIVEFSDGGTIYFGEAQISTHNGDGKGAKYAVQGLAPGPIYNGKRLLALEKYATSVDFYNERGAIFMGDRVRGIVSRRSS